MCSLLTVHLSSGLFPQAVCPVWLCRSSYVSFPGINFIVRLLSHKISDRLLRPDADLVVQALEMAFEQRGRPQGLLFVT